MIIAPPNNFPDVEEAPLEAAAAAADAELAANAEARRKLRREADKKEMRLAVHHLAEGVRGVIRTAPLLSVVLGLSLGAAWARGRRRRD